MLADTLHSAEPDRMCFVNISGQTLADESLRDFVQVQLERTGLPPESLCFEITETAAVADFARANAFIKWVSHLGCQFALDDFGAGVSSFAYLKNLPVQFLKIDGMFVRDIVSDPTNLALVRSINEVGHTMGKRTVAEFVENEEILECLRTLGVDFVQGFHVGRPRLANEVLGPQQAPPVSAAG
jgi:EAL domain-containing protein (putative c-di-GMP-specific phosphodiesterase class I)